MATPRHKRAGWRRLALGAAAAMAAFGVALGAAHAQQVVTMPRAGVTVVTAPAPGSTPGLPRVINMITEGTPAGGNVDRWATHIREAADRFGIPEAWIREVMRMESGGNPVAQSWAGAQGLMQVIPSTYAVLRAQHGLGPNAYEPRDNILAGAAYIREMYDLYGFPAFLAAYNAGPRRVEGFMSGQPLPAETVNYLNVLGPRLRGTTVAEGPLAAFLRGAEATSPTGAAVVNVAAALAAYQPAQPANAAAPAMGPQIIAVGQGGPRVAPVPRDATGLVPRGMLGGPQLVTMPRADAAPVMVPLPPAVLANLNKASRR